MKARKKEISIKVILYTHYDGKEGTNPVRLQITADRKTKYYPIQWNSRNLFLTPAQFENLGTQPKGVREAIKQAEANAIGARDTITNHGKKVFVFERFEKEFLYQESEKGFVGTYEEYLKNLLKREKIGTHNAYKYALGAFKDFIKTQDIKTEEVSLNLLKDFEAYLKKEKVTYSKGEKVVKPGRSKTTIAIYMRSLRAVYNYAISKNPSLNEYYPFARGKYKIKKGSGSKGDALTVGQLQTFIKFQPMEGTPEWVSKQFWLFSFYAQGMNLRDIFSLKYKNISWDAIRYVRQKTEDTESEEMIMEVPLSESLKSIIVKLGNPDKRGESYVFGVIDDTMDAKRKDAVIKQKIKVVNKWLGVLCKELELPEMTSYWARHSYANLLKQTGESVDLIRELLGHTDIKTTEAYLKRFDLSVKEKANDKIQLILKAS